MLSEHLTQVYTDFYSTFSHGLQQCNYCLCIGLLSDSKTDTANKYLWRCAYILSALNCAQFLGKNKKDPFLCSWTSPEHISSYTVKISVFFPRNFALCSSSQFCLCSIQPITFHISTIHWICISFYVQIMYTTFWGGTQVNVPREITRYCSSCSLEFPHKSEYKTSCIITLTKGIHGNVSKSKQWENSYISSGE